MHPEDFRELHASMKLDTPDTKPRLRRLHHIDGVERWLCFGEGLSAIARTHEAAYNLWKECMMENLRTEELVSRGWL